MENISNDINILKSNNPDKIVVYRAESLENEIRFYLNDKKYITAIRKDNNGIEVQLGEEDETEEQITLKKNKKDFKWIFILSALSLVCWAILTAVVLMLATIINSTLMYLVSINTTLLLFEIVVLVFLESKVISTNLKSKHSAEHMMVNFLESNTRLPKNMDEIKKSSRFSKECGSRKMVEGISERFVSRIFASIIAGITDIICATLLNNVVVSVLVVSGAYLLTYFILERLFNKKLEFVVKPIKQLLTNIVQYGNTTKKVSDEDIILAYHVARVWMLVVYPEFCNQEDDCFLYSY